MNNFIYLFFSVYSFIYFYPFVYLFISVIISNYYTSIPDFTSNFSKHSIITVLFSVESEFS